MPIKKTAAKVTGPYHVRWMIRRDLPEVLEIEQGNPPSWNEDDFMRCLRQRNCIGNVAEKADRVVGFVIYEISNRTVSILNLAVHPDLRRCRIATTMIGKLKSKLSPHRRTELDFKIRETNLPVQLFLAHDFKAIEVLRGHFDDTGEDAYLMRFEIEAAPFHEADEFD